ncbi:MAG: phosphotransferase [Actinomycetota bacterium]|nr:phosphotransferase [Actinomycetota bacterium]
MTETFDTAAQRPLGPGKAFALLTGWRADRIRRLRGSGNEHWMVSVDGDQLVLRRFNGRQDDASIAWEFNLITQLADRGWPIATAVAGPAEIGGQTWTVLRRLHGRQMAPTPKTSYQRGKLLARLHTELVTLNTDQRPDWERHDTAALALADEFDEAADAIAQRWPDRAAELVPRMAEFTARTTEALLAADLSTRPSSPVHGDLMPWNLLTSRGAVSGILDFEKAHVDLPATDLAFTTWGGKYERDVVAGYQSERPLPASDVSLLPLLWAGTCLAALHRHLTMRRVGRPAGGLGWAIDHALRPWGG